MYKMRLLFGVALFLVQCTGTYATCGRCNNIRVTLHCVDTEWAGSIPQTTGLACNVYRGGITLQCNVGGLIDNSVTSYSYKSGTKDIADFSAVERAESDKANGTLVVESVTGHVVYVCEATVPDINGDSHILRSNSLIVKLVSQDITGIETPGQTTDKNIEKSNSYITELPCGVPSDWYPEPMAQWYKGDDIITATVRVFPLDFAVGEYKKGSLIVHGYKSDDIGEYKCKIHYHNYTAAIAWRTEQHKEEAEEDVPDFNQNITVSWYKLSDGAVETTTTNVYVFETGVYDNGMFQSWGHPMRVTAYAIGGAIGSVTTDGRASYSWSIVGSELGLRLLNTSCVDSVKNGSNSDPPPSDKPEKRADEPEQIETNDSTSKSTVNVYTVDDYRKYAMCHYWGTDSTERTLTLNDGTMALLGIALDGPNGNALIFAYSYGFDKTKFLVDITFAGDSGSEKRRRKRGAVSEVEVQDFYQGINVVFGDTPPSENNTCAYNNKPVTLPLSNHFYQKWKSPQYQALADYKLLDNCIYNNAIYSGYSNEAEVYALNAGITSSGANKCQYYQLQRRNQRGDSLWSYIYQTVLVETLGEQGGNADYGPAEYSPPAVTWAASDVSGKAKTVTCASSNEKKTGTVNWIELGPGCEAYEAAAGVGDAGTCGYDTTVTFDMTTLSRSCGMSCVSRSRCSAYVVENTTVKPSKYPGNNLPDN